MEQYPSVTNLHINIVDILITFIYSNNLQVLNGKVAVHE